MSQYGLLSFASGTPAVCGPLGSLLSSRDSEDSPDGAEEIVAPARYDRRWRSGEPCTVLARYMWQAGKPCESPRI